MRGKGISVGHPQSRTCLRRKTLQRCKNNGEADNVVLIDVDSDNLNNVIIIDVPESLKQKLRGSNVLGKDKKSQLRTVICIDDDENSDSNHPGVGADSGHDFYNDASSSGRFCPALNHTRNSVDAVGEEYQFVQENLSPLKLSKCKRTYSGKCSSRNHYGFGPESDTDSSDNDYADCEFMEDSFGKLREQWEKANMMKKYDLHNGQSGRCDEATTCTGLRTDTQQNVRNPTDKPTEAQPCPHSRNARYEEEDRSIQSGFGNLGSTSNDPKKIPLADICLKSTLETPFSNSKAHNCGRGESFTVGPTLNNAEGKPKKHVKQGASCFLDEDNPCSRGPSVCSSHEQGNEQVDCTKKSSHEKEKTPPAEPCISNPEPTVDINFGHNKANLANEDVSFISTQPAVETEVDHGGEKFKKAPSCNSPFPTESEVTGCCYDGLKLSGEPLFQNIKPLDKLKVDHWGADGELKAVTEDTSCEGPPVAKSYIRKEKGCHQDIVKPILEEPSLCSGPCNEVRTEPNIGARELSGEFMSNHQAEEEEEDGPLDSEDGEVMRAVQGSIINEREKLKETDEYKRAVAEEWASRQQELHLQAEEAQKLRQLRKRKKAESMRLLDMERRQKQRVEEVRESQKKDEENMNLKEQIRAEVRKELNKLEITCRDMASLLRGLGIQVGGGFRPSLHEVRTAYKRALLSFHPDRACGSDIRQLVESEEKFKLISRMKEKLLTAS